MKFDIYSKVTDRIIEELEKGYIPWVKPWVCSGGAISWATGKAYSLLNQFLLGGTGEWATFEEIKRRGGKVKKGAKASFVVFWKMLESPRKDADGNVVKDADGKPVMQSIPYLRYSNVFNVAVDVEGLKLRRSEKRFEAVYSAECDEVIAGYIERSGVKFEHASQNRAYYSPMADRVVVPTREQFPETAEYYGTIFHELVHSTGHESRLNRFAQGVQPFGSEDYSKEELVAEIGSAAILSQLGVETAGSFRNSAAYIQGWLSALRNDNKLIVSAAGKAEKAMRMVLGEQNAEEKEAA